MSSADPVRLADVWSRVAIGGGAAGGLVLVLVDGMWWLARGSALVAPWAQSVLISLFVAAVLVGVVLRVGARLERQMMRVGLRWWPTEDPDLPDPGKAGSPDQVVGLTPEMIQIARNVSARLNRAA